MSAAEEFDTASSGRNHVAMDTSTHETHSRREAQNPAALAEALRAVHRTPDTPSDSDSGYEARDEPLQSVLLRRKSRPNSYDNSSSDTPEIISVENPSLNEKSSSEQLRQALPKLNSTSKGKKTYIVANDDEELREILRQVLERASHSLQLSFLLRYTHIHIGER